jgi:hypothetical protein
MPSVHVARYTWLKPLSGQILPGFWPYLSTWTGGYGGNWRHITYSGAAKPWYQLIVDSVRVHLVHHAHVSYSRYY